MRCSVVINTLNRAASLRDTLESLRGQIHDEIELIVVNGPSTDGTEELLARYAGEIKHERCGVANLSMSRNIGIRAAAGDVVAFIDDDAIPERNWLSDLVQGYVSDEISGVGGVVFDHTGTTFQFKFGIADRYGDTRLVDELPDAGALCVPGAWYYPSLLGTNSSFRRSALAAVGLFDETYEYFLDETDLVLRLIDHGTVVTGFDGAPVHHHFLPSHVRNERRTVTHWYPVIKNRTYFALRHAREQRPVLEIVQSSIDAARQRLAESQWAEEAGLIAPGTTDRARIDVDRALLDGIRLATERGTGPLPPAHLDPAPFLRYPLHTHRGGTRIALVTASYPPRPIAGISRFMSEVAPALAADGHDVRVITRTAEPPSVAWEDGVWVHRIAGEHRGLVPESFPHIDEFATSVVHELERVQPWTPVDTVYGGAWDVETLGVVRATTVPVTIMLATPALVAAEQAGWFDDPEIAPDVRSLIDLESELFRSADQVHAISAAIVETITERYARQDGPVLDPERVTVFPLGMVDRAAGERPARPISLGAGTSVLFVGRLERRKGIDVFLDAVSELAPAHPDVTFVVAGSDPAGTSAASVSAPWRSAHLRADWMDRVRFLGDIDDLLLHALYANADIVVLPSRYESFGLVVVEAMMHGAAIVSSAVGGISEVARADVDAILVPPGDVTALRTAIDGLLADPTKRSALGASARRRFEDEFGIERASRAVAALQDRLPAYSRASNVSIG
jgi:glycogen synthase